MTRVAAERIITAGRWMANSDLAPSLFSWRRKMKTFLVLSALALGGMAMVPAAPAAAATASKLPMCSATVTKHCTHPTKKPARKMHHRKAPAAPAKSTPDKTGE